MDLNLAKTVADGAISVLENSLENKPTGLSRLLLAYGPESARQFIVKRRLRLTQLRHHEEMVEQIGKLLMEARIDALKKYDSAPGNPLTRIQVEQLEKEYRLWSTFQKSLGYAVQDAADENLEHIEESREPEEGEPLWWDMFEEFASRRNEPWRVELFSKSLVLNDQRPGAISLKALWELAMMEASDFAALSVFCNSSLYVDGKPIVLMESEEQYGYQFQVNEHQLMNFALCVTKLMDRGLIQKSIVEVDTSSPVELMHRSGITCLTHEVPGVEKKVGTAVRLDAFAPTEFCLEICQLYPPELNVASDKNLEILVEHLSQYSEQSRMESADGKPASVFRFDGQA